MYLIKKNTSNFASIYKGFLTLGQEFCSQEFYLGKTKTALFNHSNSPQNTNKNTLYYCGSAVEHHLGEISLKDDTSLITMVL